MSTRKLRKDGVDCWGMQCGLQACTKHVVEVHHVGTSDTVSIHIDGKHWVTFGDPEWCAILQLEEAESAMLKLEKWQRAPMQSAKSIMEEALKRCADLGIEVGHQGYHQGAGILTKDNLEFQKKR